MDQALKLAPNGRHFAYEPIPYLYEELKIKYKDNCVVKNYAISDSSGNSNFHHVVSNPAYSGIKKRSYPKEEKISKIKIKTTTLDDQLINENRVDLIKIDVEGGEFGVLKGAEKVIEKFHPVIIFEHGLGASEYYNTSSEDIFDFFENSQYSLFTLKGFISESLPLSKDKFNDLYHRNKEYYFLAMFKV
jgi:FkbM family methyltransferase